MGLDSIAILATPRHLPFVGVVSYDGDIMDESTASLRARILARTAHIADLSVERVGDSVLITGRTDLFYYKQLAQAAVLPVCERVENRIEVSSEEIKEKG